jgi:hemerythrin-like domain-containing protein
VDVLSIIKKEHREVAALFDEANKCDAGDERLHELAKEIAAKLSTHLAIEERLFYARLKARADEEDDMVDVFEAYTEHAGAKSLMLMIKSGRKPDEQFKAEVQVLSENVKHHVKEEESKVFDLARHLLEDHELVEIGEAWEKAKQRAERSSSTNARGSRSKKRTTRTPAARGRRRTTR